MRGLSRKMKEKQRLLVRNLVSEPRGQPVKIFKLELEASPEGGVRMAVII